MHPNCSTPRPNADACRPQTVGSSNEGKKPCSHRRLQQFLSASTTGLYCLPWKTVQELGSKVHQVISQKDEDLLRCLVDCREAPLEERNKQGLTPLCNAVYSKWSDGALLLLRHGADVHNAEKRPEPLCNSPRPLMHLAMMTGSQELVRELIKGGASITIRDFDGEHCVEFHPFSSQGDLFECLASTITKEGSRRTDLLKDLLFVIRTAAPLAVKRRQVEAFIKRQPSCHQSKMFQLYAACFCFLIMVDDDGSDDDDNDDVAAAAAVAAATAVTAAADDDRHDDDDDDNEENDDDDDNKYDNRSLHYWRMSEKCTPCQLHDHKVEEEMAFRSVFADILDVKEHPLPDRLTTNANKLAIDIRALLAIEQHMPEDYMLVRAVYHVYDRLIAQGKIVTALGVLWRLTTIRQLNSRELYDVVARLRRIPKDIENTKELPLSALIDSLKTIQNCLSAIDVIGPKSHLYGAHFWYHFSYSNSLYLFEALIQTMKFHYREEVLTTSELLQHFISHVKEILRRFPSTVWQFAFRRLHGKCTSTIIKDLVAYSAEIWGKVRQVNTPLHLLSDEDGDTPLHCLARERSHEVLVQEGVLQCYHDNGADLCTRNNKGETVRSILVRRGVFTERELLPSLQCLAAAAFMGDVRLRKTVQNCQPAAVRNFLLDH